MSGISSWLWGTSQLDDAVDKATSELLPSGAEDIALNLEICDQIRSKSVPAKDAMRALKRRLNHKNPNVQLLALGLTDICIKNGGDHFLTEVASREFIDNLVSILKMPALNADVKGTILRLIQNWSVSFEGKPSLLYVTQVYKTLNMEGFTFPPKDLTVTNSAMVDTQTAPEWIDSDVCLRCRDPFTFTNRKHHCRNCGQVFDQKCSSKSIPLPHFGIAQDVRVCDGCYSKIHKKAEKANKTHRHSTSLHGSRHRTARDLADAELQRAIQLSLQETGLNGASRPGYVPSPPTWQYSEPPLVDRTTHPRPSIVDEENDPDLKAAIEASLREASAPKASAPIAVETPRSEAPSSEYSGPGYSQSYPPGVVPPHPSLPKLSNYDLEPLESDAILTFSQTIEQVQSQDGRDISRYPAVNELYDKANSLRPKLAMSLDDAGRKEEMLADMHDKLSQAVKLYDQLLSEQVAHPRWRSSQAYEQPVSNYGQSQPLTNGYSQWQSPYQVASVSSPQSALPPSSYFAPAPVPTQPTPAPSQQYSYVGSSQQYLPPLQAGENTSPISQTYQSEPVPMSPLQEAPPISYSTYPLPEKHSSPEIQTTYQVPPAPVNAAPVSAPESLPPTQHTPPALTRQNTVSSYSVPTPQPLPSRSNTVHTTYRQAPHQQAQRYAPTPPSLPQFPVAPTSAPQAFSMYEPSIPTGVAQREERQEALLIDL
ncbi:ubiquitin binding protein [Guyanagaster necrorhizus]|uniref:Vacuolar protein sorting-associated protein 27 n=1 Tax=Guyanagaster necrorhizus TaxID=856835 RepID=A0A9P7W2L7_9AGAR|nr:ubiquitin binding protein [Guyanagaster necrorhizus MCA 3950]KAG7450884.1 ubiquitin binding protein [Guyanagaster necrorhizus MCA 3950]